jgi:hypothetical protein
MENPKFSPELRPTSEILAEFWEKLPSLAKDLIEQNLDMSLETNRRFRDNPDSPAEHKLQWHQWGIITHSRKFEEFSRTEVPGHLEEWGVAQAVEQFMSEQIDGRTKGELFRLVAPVHDLGKFTTRTIRADVVVGLDRDFDFKGHEAASGRIIRQPEFSGKLQADYGLTQSQIEYVAACAERHYDLAHVRDAAIGASGGFSIAFTHSPEFRDGADRLMDKHPGFQLELGLLYLADSLAKNEIRTLAKTDAEIAASDVEARRMIAERGLNPVLVGGAKQLPVNVAMVERYLKSWAERCKA